MGERFRVEVSNEKLSILNLKKKTFPLGVANQKKILTVHLERSLIRDNIVSQNRETKNKSHFGINKIILYREKGKSLYQDKRTPYTRREARLDLYPFGLGVNVNQIFTDLIIPIPG